jgi:uroporphyrinogen-III synthase
VSRLRALGQVAWSFPLIEFTPVGSPALGDQLAASEGDLLFALSQHAVEFAHARCSSRANAGPRPALFCHWPHNGAGPAYGQRATFATR